MEINYDTIIQLKYNEILRRATVEMVKLEKEKHINTIKFNQLREELEKDTYKDIELYEMTKDLILTKQRLLFIDEKIKIINNLTLVE